MASRPSSHAVPASPWILSPIRDLTLFVATPVLILPLTLALVNFVDSPQIRYFVLAFGAMGHNLPGMLRAYGDRALFQRFKVRFILSPIVLVVLCYAFAQRQSMRLVLIAYVWSARTPAVKSICATGGVLLSAAPNSRCKPGLGMVPCAQRRG